MLKIHKKNNSGGLSTNKVVPLSQNSLERGHHPPPPCGRPCNYILQNLDRDTWIESNLLKSCSESLE